MRSSRRRDANQPPPSAPNANFAWLYAGEPAAEPVSAVTTEQPPGAALPPAPSASPAEGSFPWAPPAAGNDPSAPYAGDPMSAPWQPAPAPSTTKRNTIIGAVALVAIAGVLMATVGRSYLPWIHHGLRLPDHVGEYTAIDNQGTRTVNTTIEGLIKGIGSASVVAKEYATAGTDPGGWAMLASVPKSQRAQVTSGVNTFVVDFVTSFIAGATATAPVVEAPGPNGGFMECGLRTDQTLTAAYCAWSDGSTFSLASLFGGTVDQADQFAIQIRSADGH